MSVYPSDYHGSWLSDTKVVTETLMAEGSKLARSVSDYFGETSSINIARAQTVEERRQAYSLRYRIYIEKQGKAYPDADHDQAILTDVLDEASTILLGRFHGDLKVTTRISYGSDPGVIGYFSRHLDLGEITAKFGDAAIMFISRLAAVDDVSAHKCVYRLFEPIYAMARMRGVRFILLHTAPSLVPFFGKMGFQPLGATFDHPIVGTQVSMAVSLEDVERLRRISSPMRRIASLFPSDQEAQEWLDRYTVNISNSSSDPS